MITETQKLDEGQKQAIVDVARFYKKSFATIDNPEGLSDSKLAERADISKAYMSAIMNGQWNAMKVGKTTVAVKDVYFRRLAKAVDYKIEQVYWKHFDIHNYNECMNALDDAMIMKKPACVTGKTGSGKSYAIDRFILMNPENTYRINLDSDMTKNSFLHELASVVRVSPVGTAYRMRKAIEAKLAKDPNAKLIIDEVENAKEKPSIFGSIKAIMDALKGITPVILFGTPDLKNHIENKAAKEVTPFHQLNRRINEGIGFVDLMDHNQKEAKNICIKMGIEKLDVIEKITEVTKNVGELSGAIEKLLREIEESGEEMSVELVENLL